MRVARVWIGVVAMLAGASFAIGAPPSGTSPTSAADTPSVSERLEQDLAELERWRLNATLAELDLPLRQRIGELLLRYDLEQLDPWDIGVLADLIARDQSRLVPAARRLASMRDDTPAGLTADIVRTWLASKRLREPVEFTEIEDLLAHPAMREALQRDGAHRVFQLAQSAVATSNDIDFDRLTPRLMQLAEATDASMPVWTTLAAASLADALQERDRDHPALPTLRSRVLEAIGARRLDRPERFSHLDGALDEAARRVALLDNEAPPLVFDWSSDGFEFRSLADLRGRVVLVQFWATWCRPCVAKFPTLREITSHFEGRPVTVLGVTAVQGYHYWDPFDNAPPAVTQGDADREYALMREYIGLRDITWPIVFSSGTATRDRYFVDALPHATLIAPDGTVYLNGEALALKPKGEVVALIEGLLAEHGVE